MNNTLNPFTRLLAKVQDRFNRARAGSVMILVVGLLVVLALMATAMISATRNDRYTSQQNVANTQVDMLMEGVLGVIQSTIKADVFDGANLKPSYPDGAPTPYSNFDAPKSTSDFWLASRLPTTYDGTTVTWPAISWPLVRNNAGNFQFSDPSPNNATIPVITAATADKSDDIANIGSVTIGGRDYPALNVPGRTPGFTFGADADGDGIADSLMWELPVGQINGLTFFVGTRIIDNNSAINYNAARSRDEDYDNADAVIANRGIFPANVGLREMLNNFAASTTDYYALDDWRLNYRLSAASRPRAWLDPMNEGGTTWRADFEFFSQADAMFMQFTRRLSNPGYNFYDVALTPASRPYRPFDMADTSLAYRFCLINPFDTPTRIEQALPSSVRNAALSRNRPYPPNAAGITAWYAANFDFDGNPDSANLRPIRSILVPTNPVSVIAPAHNTQDLAAEAGAGVVDAGAWPPPTTGVDPRTDLIPNYTVGTGTTAAMQPVPQPKVSINTALFGERWRGFWSVMAGATSTAPAYSQTVTDPYAGSKFGLSSPYAPTTVQDEGRMFRSPIRDPQATATEKLGPMQMLLFRSALAAFNANTLRDGTQSMTMKTITLPADPAGQPAVDVRMYSLRPQPFITEVYCQNDNKTEAEENLTGAPATDPTDTPGGVNPTGYFAIELCNPYPFDINIAGWELHFVNRTAGGSFSTDKHFNDNAAPYVIASATAGDPVIIPAATSGPTGSCGYLVIENIQPGPTADPGDAIYRPQAVARSMVMSATSRVYAPLHRAANSELILVRPFAGGEAPIDSFDFTGYVLNPPPSDAVPTPITSWHYVRANSVAGGQNWKCVYPGRYDGSSSAIGNRRHQGTDVAPPESVPAAPNPHIGQDIDPWRNGKGAGLAPIAMGSPDITATFPRSFTIQLANKDQAGFNAVPQTPNRFPFGGFPRLGDLLQVPYIGSYRITPAGETNLNHFIELNAVTMDASFAEDSDPDDDLIEQIGRFCPLSATQTWNAARTYQVGEAVMHNNQLFQALATSTGSVPPASASSAQWQWVEFDRYAWASDLFDYFSVLGNPNEDYLPNVAATNYSLTDPPVAVQNGLTGSANAHAEDNLGVEGLININTAPWYVLAQLPLLPSAGAATGADNVPADIEALAKAIVLYRDGDGTGTNPPHGPFRSIFDLNRVISTVDPGGDGFQNGMGRITFNTSVATADDPGNTLGDFSPWSTTDASARDSVRGDFEERFLMLTRISNLITTRSDTFTAYVVLQGWRAPGTPNATMVVERRAARVFDRSGVAAPTANPTAKSVPTN